MYETATKNSSPEFRFPEQAPYFKFLTILAFNIFWKEKVDVAIVEGKLNKYELFIKIVKYNTPQFRYPFSTYAARKTII